MARAITAEETDVVTELVARARAAMAAIADYDQATVDRVIRAVGWAGGNEQTATRLASMSVDAGTFTNGMPMTSSMGCGVWGGNITNENIALKHYLNVTWVSRPIPEDRPSEQELFGEFYNSEVL